ncbi:MAG: sulfatase-like hydrolase/transferase [Phycisphaeraceae bacterium]|nr:sulfatase-like hydrolase/transferase [Phycisphaeraceae bacterium]
MSPPPRPNILIIMADQLAASYMSVYGHRRSTTPNLDRLASRGVRFGNAYTACPLCGPSRAALWTGRYPHQTGVMTNQRGEQGPRVPERMATLGQLAVDAGYRPVHFGKGGAAGGLRGFECVRTEPRRIDPLPGISFNADTFKDLGATDGICDYLRRRPDQPFLAVADLNNPHNICGWVGDHADDDSEHPDNLPAARPELPANFQVDDMATRPLPVQYLCCIHRRQKQAARWSPRMFQGYLAAYEAYTQLMDQCAGRILQSLDESGEAENTIVIFHSDHGDAVATRRMVTKHCCFYEPVVNVPLIVAGPGVAVSPDSPRGELVSLLDIVPTVCDLIGADAPDDLPGLSLRPMLEGRSASREHDCIVSQWHTEYGHTIEPGRMIRTPRYKYTIYREGPGEELYELERDPLEMRNLVHDPAMREVLEEHRHRFEAYLDEEADPFRSMDARHDHRWRSHEPGFKDHTGPCSWDEPIPAS